MSSGTDSNKHFNIQETPERLRRLVAEREHMYLGEIAYRTLRERGQIDELLDSEVKRIQSAFLNLAKELQAKGYSDQEARERAWQSLVRNWPFALDDGEPEKEAPSEIETPCWPSLVTVTAKNGRRYVLVYQEPMSERFKQFVRTLQGETGMCELAGERSLVPDDLPGETPNREQRVPGASPFDKRTQEKVRRKAKELLKKQNQKAGQPKGKTAMRRCPVVKG